MAVFPLILALLATAPPAVAKAFGEQYGPYAFGLVSFLILWFVCIRPMAQQLETTALVLNRAIDKFGGVPAKEPRP